MDKTGIPLQSIKATSVAYAKPLVQSILFIIVGSWLVHSFNYGDGILLPILPGLLRKEDVKDLRWGLLTRVSTGMQSKNASTDTQIDQLKTEVERVDGEIKETYEVAESAATTERDSTDELATLAEQDEIDIIGVSKLDRLTRAIPWESILYLKRLKESGVILYAGTHGYFEWDDLYDFQLILRQVVFAREWYERLHTNRREGQIRKLERGKWPFGHAPYGYKKEEDQTVYLTKTGAELIPEIFEVYLEVENQEEVKRQIEKNHDLENLPSVSQIRNLLSHPLCLGELALEDQVVKKNKQLEAVDPEVFQAVQEALGNQGNSSGSAPEVPNPIDEISKDFGPGYTVTQLGSISKVCRKCGSSLRKNGTQEKWGTTVQNYKCTNCAYQSPLLTKEEFDKFHQTLPLQCPFCPSTENFEIERTPDGDYEYTYQCEQCGKQIGIDTLPDKYQRAINNQDWAIDWYSDPVRESTPEAPSEKNTATAEPAQKELADF